MSIAELVEEYGNINDDGYNDAIKNNMRLAINEALELAAQVALKPLCGNDDCKCRIHGEQIAESIRRLKSPAQEQESA